jgi:hypothetical protein
VQALIRCLGESEDAHIDRLDMLERADKHRDKARRHAAAIAASQDTDNPDPDDADVELACEAERKRLIEIAGRASAVSPSAAHRARLIAVARAGHLA